MRTAARKASKYRNVHTEYNGVKYASKAEARYAADLDIALKAGMIRPWARQVPFMLGIPEHKYVVDFVVWHLDGRADAVDVKGAETPKFREHKRLWARYGPIELYVIKGGKVAEIVVPKCIGGDA